MLPDSQHVLANDGDVALLLNTRPPDMSHLCTCPCILLSTSLTQVITKEARQLMGRDGKQVSPARVLVSPNHLALASPVFSRLFQVGFKEGTELSKTKSLELPLPDDDSDALLILLEIFHGRYRQVPRQVSLDQLAAIAILVDKYDCLESAELFFPHWRASVAPDLPVIVDHSFMRWLCVAYVFRLEEFRALTATAQKCSDGPLSAENLVIPYGVLGQCFPMCSSRYETDWY